MLGLFLDPNVANLASGYSRMDEILREGLLWALLIWLIMGVAVLSATLSARVKEFGLLYQDFWNRIARDGKRHQYEVLGGILLLVILFGWAVKASLLVGLGFAFLPILTKRYLESKRKDHFGDK